MIQPNSLSLNAQQLLEQLVSQELNEQPLYGSHWIQTLNPNLPIDVRLAKTIANQIYDSKGLIKDDLDSTLRAIRRIKDAKQFELVQTELRKLTNGRGIGQYIASFLGTMFMGVEINMTEALETGRAIVKHLQTIKADPKTIDIINNRIAKASVQKSLTDSGWGQGTPGVLAIESLNFISEWLNDHDTWDSFINGPQGLRDAVFDWKGIVITTILAYTPLKPVEMVIFALLVIDDIKRFSEQGFQWDILFELIFDVIGLLIGGAAKWIQTGLKATLRPIGKGLMEIFEKLVANGGVQKLIERLIKLILPYAERLAKSKIGQLIAKVGGKIGNLIARVVDSAKSALKSLIGAFLNIANKLKGTKFYKKAMAIVKMLSTVTKWIVGSFIDAIKWIFKTIWAVVSFPGKSIAWILEKLGFKAAAPIGKLVFNNGALAYILQNHAKWMDEYREKTGVYKRDELIDVALNNGFATFKQQNEEHVAKTSKGEYVKLKVTDDPWLFVIVEPKGKWTEIIMDDGIKLWVKTAEITEKYGEVQQ